MALSGLKGPTLKSYLIRPKDTPETTRRDGFVYEIPRECGKVCTGETGRAMQEQIKEYYRDIWFARRQSSALLERANNMGHLPIWDCFDRYEADLVRITLTFNDHIRNT